uniref:Uncharacterized protein n=1 Tax=Periophthalmus magnuspinnatus TaxID=409849 RepID=A0A3B4AEQ3_9GOBI
MSLTVQTSFLLHHLVISSAPEAQSPAMMAQSEFQCAHGKRCIPKEQVCDGQSDCQDRSDEMNCRSAGEGCHQWCDNNTRCIPDTFLCDGEKDCADGSDENKCGKFISLTQSLLSLSVHNNCLQKEWICDGEKDCADGYDERVSCPEKKTISVFRVVSSDININGSVEMTVSASLCPGGVMEKRTVRMERMKTSVLSIFDILLFHKVLMYFCSYSRLMFWSEIGSTPQIEQAGMDGSKRKVVVSQGLSWPVSLAFDVLDNRIYWADEKLRCIGSASMDGENVKVKDEKHANITKMP